MLQKEAHLFNDGAKSSENKKEMSNFEATGVATLVAGMGGMFLIEKNHANFTSPNVCRWYVAQS